MNHSNSTPTAVAGGAPTLRKAIITGALGFGIVSLCVFATVAFAERWMYEHLGLVGSYLVWTLLFILLGGGVLGSLLSAEWKLLRFYLLFAAAFFAYAVGWTGAYFTLRGTSGEWAGSVVGSMVMGTILAAGLGALHAALKLSLVLYAANSAGYFLGSALNEFVGGSTGMMLWGGVYGLCLGGGLGATIHMAQRDTPPR